MACSYYRSHSPLTAVCVRRGVQGLQKHQDASACGPHIQPLQHSGRFDFHLWLRLGSRWRCWGDVHIPGNRSWHMRSVNRLGHVLPCQCEHFDSMAPCPVAMCLTSIAPQRCLQPFSFILATCPPLSLSCSLSLLPPLPSSPTPPLLLAPRSSDAPCFSAFSCATASSCPETSSGCRLSATRSSPF